MSTQYLKPFQYDHSLEMHTLLQSKANAKKSRIRRKKPEQTEQLSRRKSVSLLRIQIELDRLELPSDAGIKLLIPNKDHLDSIDFEISPQRGYWKGATYLFHFQIPDNYPMIAPSVQCMTKIYHPNIDYSGNVCMSILKTEWSPLCNIEHILNCIMQILYQPDGAHANNEEAGKLFRENIDLFQQTVSRTLKGGQVNGVVFPAMLNADALNSKLNDEK